VAKANNLNGRETVLPSHAVIRRHDGDLQIDRDQHFLGVIRGSVTVHSRSHLFLIGTIMKDLIVRTDGTAIVEGTIRGDLRVQTDGSAIIHGEVLGSVLNEGGEAKIVEDE
jgi:hypothetical protein